MTARLTAIAADGSRKAITLGKLIHKGGGAGRIYALKGDRQSVIKLYHNAKIAGSYRDKIRAMLEHPPVLPPIEEDGRRYVQIAWPQAAVHDGAGHFRGFVMPFIDLSEAAPLETLLVRALRQHHGLPENYANRLYAAQNLAAAIAELHRLGHHVIDLKPQNLSIYKRSMYVAVLDCDGLSIDGGEGRRFPALQYTDGYRAPEAVSKDLAPDELGEDQDRFALGVILFQLMNDGIHPFQGVPRRKGQSLGTLQERINAGLYPYGRGKARRQSPSPGSLHGSFEDETLELFRRTFATKYRPRAGEWRDHIRGLIAGDVLTRCAKNPAEHAHFSKGCGLCARDARTAGRLKEAQERRARGPATARKKRRTGGFPIIWGPKRTTRQRPPPRRTPPPPSWPPRRRRVPQTMSRIIARGILGLLRRLLFGKHQPPVIMTAPRLGGLIALYLVYGAFVINLGLLSGFIWSMFDPREFQAVANWLMQLEMFQRAGRASARVRLQDLQALTLVAVFFATIAGVVISTTARKSMAGTYGHSHATWLAMTAVYSLVVAMAILLLAMVTWPMGVLILPAFPLWLYYRCGRGLYLLVNNRPLPAPSALL